MAAPCTVCTHAQGAAIDEALVAHGVLRDLALRFGVSRWALGRHARRHLSESLRARWAEREAARGETLLDRLEVLYDRVDEILEAAEAEGRPVISLLAARELRQCIELLGRFTGQVGPDSELIVKQAVTFQVTSYDGGLVAAEVLRILEPWPEAQAAVRALLPLPATPPATPALPAAADVLAPPRPAPAGPSLHEELRSFTRPGGGTPTRQET